VGKPFTDVLVSVKPNRVAGGSGPPPPVEPLTVSVKDRLAVCFGEEESVTWTVKVKVPVLVVVPETDPVDCTVIPEGREPEVRAQL
jgi:hypothetical protein